MLHDIWMADTRQEAEGAFDLFLTSFCGKYPKATECLAKDREVLLTFYDHGPIDPGPGRRTWSFHRSAPSPTRLVIPANPTGCDGRAFQNAHDAGPDGIA